MSVEHEWTYNAGDGEPIVLTAKDAAQEGEPPTPIIETNLSLDDYEAALESGILLDACAAEILRLVQRVAELEAEPARIRRALLRRAGGGLHKAIFAETQSKARHQCDYTEVALQWLTSTLDQIVPKVKP